MIYKICKLFSFTVICLPLISGCGFLQTGKAEERGTKQTGCPSAICEGSDPSERQNFVLRLADRGDEGVIEILLSSLQDGNPVVRHAAAYALGDVEVKATPQIINSLLERLKDENPWVRDRVIAVLGRIAARDHTSGIPIDKRLLDVFLDYAKHDDPYTRSTTIESFDFLKDDQRAKETYLAASQDDVWVARRRAKKLLLWQSSSEEAFQRASDAIRDETQDVRLSAIDFLGRHYLGNLDEPQNITDPRVVDLLIERLWDTDGQVVYEAIWHAAATKVPKGFMALVALSNKKPIWQDTIRGAILQQTGKPLEEISKTYSADTTAFQDDHAPIRHADVQQQISLLRKGSPLERVSSALRLTWADTAEAADALLKALQQDEEPRVRFAAANGLDTFKGRSRDIDQVVQGLLAEIKTRDPFVRRAAVSALGTHSNGSRGSEVVESLEKIILTDKDPFVRLEAVGSLAWASKDGKKTSLILAKALTDGFYEVREGALFGIHWECVPEKVGVLSRALSDPNVRVRRMAAFRTAVSTPESVPALLRALNDPDEGVRRYAVHSLGHFDKVEVVERLKVVAESDVSEDVRKSAGQSIEQLRMHQAQTAEQRRQWEEWHNENIRKSCGN
jgi:HEAT repeat protein